jgi:hypothetical protein
MRELVLTWEDVAMSTGTQSRSAAGKDETKKAAGSSATPTVRNKRAYTHVMTDAEKFALRIVLNGKSACTQLAIAIQEGKTIKPEILKACGELYTLAGTMLFS